MSKEKEEKRHQLEPDRKQEKAFYILKYYHVVWTAFNWFNSTFETTFSHLSDSSDFKILSFDHFYGFKINKKKTCWELKCNAILFLINKFLTCYAKFKNIISFVKLKMLRFNNHLYILKPKKEKKIIIKRKCL